jgi:hypothetical protein
MMASDSGVMRKSGYLQQDKGVVEYFHQFPLLFQD